MNASWQSIDGFQFSGSSLRLWNSAQPNAIRARNIETSELRVRRVYNRKVSSGSRALLADAQFSFVSSSK